MPSSIPARFIEKWLCEEEKDNIGYVHAELLSHSACRVCSTLFDKKPRAFFKNTLTRTAHAYLLTGVHDELLLAAQTLVLHVRRVLVARARHGIQVADGSAWWEERCRHRRQQSVKPFKSENVCVCRLRLSLQKASMTVHVEHAQKQWRGLAIKCFVRAVLSALSWIRVKKS